MGGSGGGVWVPDPPLLAHDVGFLTLDPLLNPLFLLVGLRWTPPPSSKILDPPLCLLYTGCHIDAGYK